VSDVHPATGRYYVHVFVDDASPDNEAFAETRSSWAKVDVPWMHVMKKRNFDAAKHLLLEDPDAVIVLWGDLDASLPPLKGRKCRLTYVYTETLGKEGLLTEYQMGKLKAFEDRRDIFDAVIVQTPPMMETAKARGWRSILCPTAWDPACLGEPNFSIKKQIEIATYGVKLGHRTFAFNEAKRLLQQKLVEVTGFFGNLRKTTLDAATAVLTLLHCPGASYPTMRLWQAAATSAAMISEIAQPDDAWPAVAGAHYLPLPILTVENASAALGGLTDFLSGPQAPKLAKEAHEYLKQFTPSFCMDRYLIPGLEEIQ
jgi:hypothetical protein